MFQIGDRVIYSTHGVCDITQQEVKTVDKKQLTYLVLEPLGQPGSRFLVPTHNAAAMGKLKKMMTKEELLALITSDAVRQDCWIRDEGTRKQTYRECIGSGDRQALMAMVHTLYQHKKVQAAAGRKVHLCDDNFLRDAEKLLISEIAIVMAITADQAKQYLHEKLQ